MTGFNYTHRVGHGRNLTAAEVDANFEAASVAVDAKPELQVGTLVASTIEAAPPTAVIDYVAARIAADVVAAAPSGLNNFDKVAAAIGDDPAYAVTAAAATTAAANAAAAAAAVASAANTLAAAAAPAYAEVQLGTGSTLTLTATANADRQNTYTGTGATVALSATGATGGKQMWVTHAGGSGTMLFTGVTASTNHRLTISNGETFSAIFAGSTWYSLTPATTAASSALGVVSGTGTIGSTLTFTPASGFVGTYQWYRSDTSADIGGATSATYVIQAGDATHTVAMKYTPTRYESNGIAVSSAAPGQVTSFAFGAAADSTLAYSFSAPGSGGAPTSYIVEYRTPTGSGAYTTWGGHSGTSLSGTITGLTPGTSYEGRCTAHNASGDGTPSATNIKSTTSSKITFGPDTFTGSLNARWTGSVSGWATDGAGSLVFTGSLPGTITATSSAGDNTLTVDLDNPEVFAYPTLVLRYIDGSNAIYCQFDDSLGVDGLWTMGSGVGGVFDPANVATDTLHRGGTGVNKSTVSLAVVGNTVTFTSVGGLNPGSFSKTMTGISALGTATKVGFQQQPGKPLVLWDNATLS